MADLLMRNGIDPRAITSEAQLKIIIKSNRSYEKANNNFRNQKHRISKSI